jgi:TonB family protein
MRLSISILILAICSSLVFAQNGEEPKNSVILNTLEPTFKGTNESFDINEFIQENLRTPLKGQNWGVEGAVVVQFNVNPTGNLSEIQVIESVSPEFDHSVISTLEATNGMWNPGTINDRPVPMEKEMVVVFKTEGTDLYQAAQTNKNKADKMLKEGKYSKAVKIYTRAVGSCPTSDIIIYRRGLARYYSGDLEGAIIDFERVANLDSHLAEPMLNKLNKVVDYADSELQLSSLNY